MPFGFHATLVLFDEFYGAVAVMETGFEYSQLFGVLRVLFEVIDTKVATEDNVTAIIAFFSGDDIQ